MRILTRGHYCVLLLAAGSVSASPLCTINSVSTSCVSQSSFSFNDTANWATLFGSADQNNLQADYNPNTTYTTNSPWVPNGGAGTADIANVTLGPGYSGPSILSRVDNTYWAWAPDSGQYIYGFNNNSASDPNPNSVAGRFGNSQDWNNPSEYNWGDNLLEANSSKGPIAISFVTTVSAVGFRVSTASNSDFTATINAYSGTEGSGTLLGTYALNTNGTGGGGGCNSLASGSPPAPCDDAPFIGIDDQLMGLSASDGYPGFIQSITITTDDTTGLFIDQLSAEIPSSVPEPGSTFLLAGGCAVLAVMRRKRNRPRTLAKIGLPK